MLIKIKKTHNIDFNRIKLFIKNQKSLVDDIGGLTKSKASKNREIRKARSKNIVYRFVNSIRLFYQNNELFKYASWSLCMLVISTTVLTIIEWDTFYSSVSEHISKENPSNFDTILNTFWWSVVTFTTVGYGDVSPITHEGKIISIFIMILNFCIVTLLGGAVASVLVEKRLKGDDKLDENKFKNHLIIAGWNNYISDMLGFIDENRDSLKSIILINQSDNEVIKRALSKIKRLDIVHLQKNYTQEKALLEAFIEKSSLFMIVPDYSGLLPNEKPDEDKSVLAALTAKSINEDIIVVAHIENHEYQSHLQRANVNDVVFTDPHIPHMLAKHVTDPGVPQFFDELIDHENEDTGIHVVDIPEKLKNETHDKISAYYQYYQKSLLLGYAINKAGFSIIEEMGNSGSEVIRKMITEQLDGAGIKLSSDERIVVEVNPELNYKIDDKHKAIILR